MNRSSFVSAIAAFATTTALLAQNDPASAMRWRGIGPFRGGRTVAAVGVRQQPNVFYIGVNNGGVWKTTDYGRIWSPIFDQQPTGSIGAISVAPSDPNRLFVAVLGHPYGPNQERGIFRSTDGGQSFQKVLYKDENTGAMD